MITTTQPAASAAPARLSAALAAFSLAVLLGLQPITTDVYLPALPLLARDLAAPMAGVQLTMSGLILAFGFGQLAWGPIADRVGRRPALLAGLALYTLAAVAGAMAPSIDWLIGWRILQGVGLAAAVVIARAMVRDLYEPVQGAHVMALAMAGLGVIAITGPSIGGLVAHAAGWRAVLATVAVVGATLLAFVAWRVPETIAQRNPHATDLRPLAASWWQIGRDRRFVAWAGLTAFTYGGVFTFLAGSSFVLMGQLGLSATVYGITVSSVSVAYLLGTLACRRWIPRLGLAGTVRRGAWFTAAGGASLVLLALAGVHTVWAVIVPQWLFAFGHGQHQPCGQAAVVGPFPRSAGAASALAGFVLAVVAFGIGRWLGWVLTGGMLPYALTVGAMAAGTVLFARTLVQRAA